MMASRGHGSHACISPFLCVFHRLSVLTNDMDAKDNHAVVGSEKGFTPSDSDGDVVTTHNAERPGLMTRLGLTGASFQRRTLDDKHNQLNKTLKTRHLNMIAIGGSIGAGLFVGSGGALATGGPAGLLIAFSIIGIMMFMVVYALGELAIQYAFLVDRGHIKSADSEL